MGARRLAPPTTINLLSGQHDQMPRPPASGATMVDCPRIAPPPTSRQHGHTKLRVRCRISAEQGDYGPERCYALHHGSRKHHTAPHTSSRWISSPVHNALQPLSWGPPMPPREGPTPPPEKKPPPPFAEPCREHHCESPTLLQRASRQIYPTTTEIQRSWPWIRRRTGEDAGPWRRFHRAACDEGRTR
jgi:hypothetical protein